jgi:hypothetical protein
MLKELGRLCEKKLHMEGFIQKIKLHMGFMFLAHQWLTMIAKCCIFV